MELIKRSASRRIGGVIGKYPKVAGKSAAERAGSVIGKTPEIADESAIERVGGILTHKIPKIAKESAAKKAGNITDKAHGTAGASTTAVERAGDIIAKSMGGFPLEATRISHKETISMRMPPGLVGRTVARIPLASVAELQAKRARRRGETQKDKG